MDEKNYWVLKGRIGWYQGEQGEQSFVDETIVGRFDNTVYPTDWALFSTGFICPPPAADSGRWEFTFSFLMGAALKLLLLTTFISLPTLSQAPARSLSPSRSVRLRSVFIIVAGGNGRYSRRATTTELTQFENCSRDIIPEATCKTTFSCSSVEL